MKVDLLTKWTIVDRHARVVVIDLSRSTELMTVDFARLLLLRRQLLAHGRDLQLAGLQGRAKSIYEISRLHAALPQA